MVPYLQGCSKHDCSPVLVFCFLYVKISNVTNINKMRLNVCVNMMAPFMHLLSMAKHPLTAMAQKEVYPRDEIMDPLGTNVFLIDRHGFAEGFVSFRRLCGV